MPLPSTPLLDDFSRPNEDPLSSQERWSQLAPNLLAGMMDVTNNRCRGLGAAYWNPEPGLTESEVWVTVDARSSTIYLFLRVDPSGFADGYVATIVGAVPQIRKMVNESIGSVLVTGSANVANGDIWIFRSVSNLLTLYRIRSGVAYQVASANDSAYTSGYIGIGCAATTDLLYNVGGGSLNNPQIPSAHPIGGYGAT